MRVRSAGFSRIELPQLSKAELTPAVVKLLEMVQELAERVQLQEEEIGRLKDEIAVLNQQKKRPIANNRAGVYR